MNKNNDECPLVEGGQGRTGKSLERDGEATMYVIGACLLALAYFATRGM